MMRAFYWVWMLALAAGTATLFGGLRMYQVRRSPDPEVVRKLFHIGGGVMALALPWLFEDVAPVLVLGTLLGIAFVVVRVVPNLREGVGQVLLGVGRRSVGEFGFVASICLLFWLSHGDKLLYSIPLLMVALADALAALIGRRYGTFRLHMRGDRKTIEGVVTFFLTAFLCVHIPVLLWGNTGRPESLLIALNVAAMVMLAEAAAWWGLDNLLIPTWGFMVLKSLLAASTGELIVDFTFLAGLTAFVYYWRKHTTLGDDALAGSVLWGYVAWSVGGMTWFAAPLLQFATYATITPLTPHDQRRTFRFPVALANMAGAIPWLLAYRQSGDAALHVPFATCFAANVAIIAVTRLYYAFPSMAEARAVPIAIATGMLVMILSSLAAWELSAEVVVAIGAGLVSVTTAVLVFHRLQPNIRRLPMDTARWLRQVSIVTTSSAVAYAIFLTVQPRLNAWLAT